MTFKWIVPPEDAFLELYDDYARRIYRAIAELARSFAPRIEAHMKQSAVWTDRTGNARQSLYAKVETTLTEIAIAFDYGVEYGKYLEFSNQSQYGITGITLDVWGQRFWDAVKALFQ